MSGGIWGDCGCLLSLWPIPNCAGLKEQMCPSFTGGFPPGAPQQPARGCSWSPSALDEGGALGREKQGDGPWMNTLPLSRPIWLLPQPHVPPGSTVWSPGCCWGPPFCACKGLVGPRCCWCGGAPGCEGGGAGARQRFWWSLRGLGVTHPPRQSRVPLGVGKGDDASGALGCTMGWGWPWGLVLAPRLSQGGLVGVAGRVDGEPCSAGAVGPGTWPGWVCPAL